ncbi:MAG: hypothetical protein RLZZ524_2127, partial [Pseudomonadota bacterium]
QASTVYVCHIELRAKDTSEVQQQALQLAQLRNTLRHEIEAGRTAYRALLKAPGEQEDDDEQRDVADEFSPAPAPQEKRTQALAAKIRTAQATVETAPAEEPPQEKSLKKPAEKQAWDDDPEPGANG